MKPVLLCLLLISWLAPVQAQSPFDGTWKVDFTEPPTNGGGLFKFLLEDRRSGCTTCDPGLYINAHNRETNIAGEPCYDTFSLKMVDDRTIFQTEKREGKTVGTLRMTVSSDGNSAQIDWMESCNVIGIVVSGQSIFRRVTKGPPGSHAISGSWQMVKRQNVTVKGLIMALKLEDDTFNFADATAQSFAARLDGPETVIKGSPYTMAAAKRIDENTIEVTLKDNEKTATVWRFTLSADGEAMTISVEDKVKGTVQELIAHKR